MSWLSRLSTRHRFSDGGEMSPVSRMALRYIAADGRTFTIGFEQALESGIDRLVHPQSIERVGVEQTVPISEEERTELLARVADYCHAKQLKYQLQKASSSG
jgi:hypothetical protein